MNSFDELRQAVIEGNLNNVKCLLNQYKTELKPIEKDNLMYVAIKNGKFNIFLFFIEECGYPLIKNIYFDDIINLDIVKYIVEKGYSKNLDRNILLKAAGEVNNLDVVRYLVENENKYNLNLEWYYGWGTPLERAARHGNFEIVKYLCSIDNGKCYINKIVIAAAVRNGNLELLKFVLDQADDIKLSDLNWGSASFHHMDPYDESDCYGESDCSCNKNSCHRINLEDAMDKYPEMVEFVNKELKNEN